ncbi:hypothetical protein [Phenylobacterium montanum]|uniref:MFS transporter n=1 Tax=Phenylobacterium montanum TaxID=2823693 RepID=A0A975G2B4_9CAUL|nr:hypothetical protein [Caulobacter sp. S6]QUD89833.1 hypothetical protein KCG34_08170 [Caulobacter sp. S6]
MHLAAIVVLGASGFGAFLGLPVILGALAAAHLLSDAQLGWLASAELLALMGGSLLATRLLRVRTWALVLPAILVAALADALSGGAHSAAWLFALRAIAGCGEGVCYSVALARLTAFGDPTKNASGFTAGVILGGSILLYALPVAEAKMGLPGVFGFLGLCLVAAAVLAPFLPNALPHSDAVSLSESSGSSGAWLGRLLLGGVFFYNLGFTSFWAYSERLGLAGRVSQEQISAALSAANLISAASCLAAYWIGRRWGVFKPQILAFLAVALIFATWSTSDGAAGYWARTMVYFQLLAVAVVLQLSLVAQVDRTGRIGALVPAAQGVGQALGPALGAYLLGFGHGYGPELAMESVSIALAALATAGGYWLAKATHPHLARPACAQSPPPQLV